MPEQQNTAGASQGRGDDPERQYRASLRGTVLGKVMEQEYLDSLKQARSATLHPNQGENRPQPRVIRPHPRVKLKDEQWKKPKQPRQGLREQQMMERMREQQAKQEQQDKQKWEGQKELLKQHQQRWAKRMGGRLGIPSNPWEQPSVAPRSKVPGRRHAAMESGSLEGKRQPGAARLRSQGLVRQSEGPSPSAQSRQATRQRQHGSTLSATTRPRPQLRSGK